MFLNEVKWKLMHKQGTMRLLFFLKHFWCDLYRILWKHYMSFDYYCVLCKSICLNCFRYFFIALLRKCPLIQKLSSMLDSRFKHKLPFSNYLMFFLQNYLWLDCIFRFLQPELLSHTLTKSLSLDSKETVWTGAPRTVISSKVS